MIRIKPFRVFFLIPVLWVALGFIASIFSIQVAMTLIIVGAANYVTNYVFIKCPTCGKSPYLRKIEHRILFGPRVYTSPIVETQCSICGDKLP